MVAARMLIARTAAQSPSSPTEAMMWAVSTARRTGCDMRRGESVRVGASMAPTISAPIVAVVGRSAEPVLVREQRSRAGLVRADERRVITAHEDVASDRRYGDAVRDLQGILARATALLRRDELLVAVLTVVGELEVLLEPAAGGSRLVSALAYSR